MIPLIWQGNGMKIIEASSMRKALENPLDSSWKTTGKSSSIIASLLLTSIFSMGPFVRSLPGFAIGIFRICEIIRIFGIFTRLVLIYD